MAVVLSDRFGAGVVFGPGYVHSRLFCAHALHVELTPAFTPGELISRLGVEECDRMRRRHVVSRHTRPGKSKDFGWQNRFFPSDALAIRLSLSSGDSTPTGFYILNSHLTLLRLQRTHAIELRTIFGGFFSSSPPLMTPPLPSSTPRLPELGSPVVAILTRYCMGEGSCCRCGWAAPEKASAWVRFGLVDRDGPRLGSSSGGAEGDRIAARECGEGIVAVGEGPSRDPDFTSGLEMERNDVGVGEEGDAHQETKG
jgi:hypothetical protein